MASLPNDLARVGVDQLERVEDVIARAGGSLRGLAHQLAGEHEVCALELALAQIGARRGGDLARLFQFPLAFEIAHPIAREETHFPERALIQEGHNFFEENVFVNRKTALVFYGKQDDTRNA